jgi:Domain of unknown function (DUF4126)
MAALYFCALVSNARVLNARLVANSAARTFRRPGSGRVCRRAECLCNRRRVRFVRTFRTRAVATGTVTPPNLARDHCQRWPVCNRVLCRQIPAFDLIWSALHTFIRVPVAGLIAYGATRQLTPSQQLLAAFLGALIALAAHGGKTALRAAVTPSPEPFSNISLSLDEDVLAVGLTWLATRHPYVGAGIVLALIIVIVLLARLVVNALRALFRGAEGELASDPN